MERVTTVTGCPGRHLEMLLQHTWASSKYIWKSWMMISWRHLECSLRHEDMKTCGWWCTERDFQWQISGPFIDQGLISLSTRVLTWVQSWVLSSNLTWVKSWIQSCVLTWVENRVFSPVHTSLTILTNADICQKKSFSFSFVNIGLWNVIGC